MTATLSVAAPQLRLIVLPAAVAVRVPGALGGVASATVAGASFEAALMLPAASSAVTL